MDIKKRLANWLYHSKKDFREGIAIMEELKIDPKTIRFLQQKKTSKIHQSILVRKLSNYARVQKIFPAPFPVSAEKKAVQKGARPPGKFVSRDDLDVNPEVSDHLIQRPKVDKNPVVRYEDLPVNLRVLFDENGKMMAENKAFHAELKQLKDDETATDRRKILAEELISRQKATRENWDIIDAWWAKKQESDPLRMAAEEALSKDRRIKANLAYIRRYLGKEKVKDEVELRMKELDSWEVDYGSLTKNFDGVWR